MKKIKILFLAFFLLLIVGFFWWGNGTSPVNSNDTSQKTFVVRQGSGIKEIATDLRNERLIRDPIVFFLLIKLMQLDNKIQYGDFRLSPSMKAQTIARNLTHGSLDAWITIPEGKRAEEIADVLQRNIPTYNESWRALLITEEGYLFPDTYLIAKDATIEQIIAQMKSNFEIKFSSIPNVGSSRLTREDIVTIASLIEREAKHDQDRPLIASVILNRLDIGMALQIDATVQYILGYIPSQQSWWKKNLTRNDLSITSDYNTYLHPGLPPEPIANPGFDVLNATVNPAKTDYLYYITDQNGVNHYARTLDEHNANIQRYGL